MTIPANVEFHDCHFHLTNYIQEGLSIPEFIEIMGDRVGRSTLFGLPLQQTWSYQNSGDHPPTYYLHTDAHLYYYSFTDAMLARMFQQLPAEMQARFDPMIIGFNPADMYAVDHIRRVLELFPGVFTGIGEFSIHKEFVSSKIPGEIASLTNPALDRIFDFCAEVGLISILHNDIDMPFAKAGGEPIYLTQAKDLFRRHPNCTIIWAHTGLGRVVQPRPQSGSSEPTERSPRHLEVLEAMLVDSSLKHLYFDISWDEVAKYINFSSDTLERTAKLLERFPDRFLFGTDCVAPKDKESYYKVVDMYDALWRKLSTDASSRIRKGNYERLFDASRRQVRAWEAANVRREWSPNITQKNFNLVSNL